MTAMATHAYYDCYDYYYYSYHCDYTRDDYDYCYRYDNGYYNYTD